MMDDLISRKVLMEGRVENDPVRIAAMCAPAAFDKEKVIEELKTRRDWYDINEQPKNPRNIQEICEIRERKGKWIAYNGAIEIVEKGGIE